MLQPAMQIHFRQFAPLSFTLLLHGVFLLVIFIGFSQHPVSLPALPEITVSLIAPATPAPPAPAPPVVTPKAEPPKPIAKVQPTPVARTPEPAITHPATPPEKPAEATPAPASTPAKAANSESTVITPARFDAAYLNNPKPAYPPLSRRLNEEGRVVLRVQISAEGTATEVTVHTGSGFPRLDNAALEAVRQWRFIPAKQGGQAVASTVLVPMPFELNK